MGRSSPIARARVASRATRPTHDIGMCLKAVRECYGIPALGDFDGDGDADAMDAWKAAKHKHRVSDPRKIPRGVPVFWSGGTRRHGHVAIATGFVGRCWSTDIKRAGFFDKAPIDLITERWGMTLLGWVEDLNGRRVWNGKKWVSYL